MSFSAGGIASSLGLDLSGFSGGMLQATSIAQVFPGVVTAYMANPILGLIETAKLGAAAIGAAFTAIAATVSEAGQRFDDVGEAAQKAGVSASFLSTIGAAASDAGSSTEGLGDALKFLNNNAADAAAGGEVAKAFSDIGVTATDAAGKIKPTEQLFGEVADAISTIEDPARRVQAAMNLLGRGGTDLIPLLMGGSGGINAAAAELTEFGGVVDDRMAKAGDVFGRLGVIVANAMTGIGDSLALPILEFFSTNLDEIKQLMRDIVPAAKQLAQAIGENLAQSLKVMLDLAVALAPYLTQILQTTTDIVNSVGGAINGVGASYGFGGTGGNSNPVSARSAPQSVTFGNVNVSVDPDSLARSMTSQLTPALQSAVSGVRSGIEGSSRIALVGRGL